MNINRNNLDGSFSFIMISCLNSWLYMLTLQIYTISLEITTIGKEFISALKTSKRHKAFLIHDVAIPVQNASVAMISS